MIELIRKLFYSDPYHPHGFCYQWEPGLVWLHATSDVLIFLAYFTIPLSLFYFVRQRRDLPFNWMFVLFGMFIISCGLTHLMEVITLRTPVYWLSGTVKAWTALASVPTAMLLLPLIPKALALPSPAQLQAANDALRQAGEQLEQRVKERTAELEEQARDLAAARDSAVVASQAKSSFLAHMSHELRTPLNAIIGYAELLEEEIRGGKLNEGMLEDLAHIQSSGRHLVTMISDILDISKIEAGRMALNVSIFPIREIVQQVQKMGEGIIQKNSNKLVVQVAEDAGEMESDPVKLRQILLNLFSNAAKFTHNGTITMHVERQPDWVVFSVRDTGMGIRPEDMGHLFDKFYQADVPVVKKAGGTGLGLAICRAFSDLMGGSISVSSVQGEGATFVVRLPICVPEAKRIAASED